MRRSPVLEIQSSATCTEVWLAVIQVHTLFTVYSSPCSYFLGLLGRYETRVVLESRSSLLQIYNVHFCTSRC